MIRECEIDIVRFADKGIEQNNIISIESIGRRSAQPFYQTIYPPRPP